jgi:hypothetical protein
LPESRRGWLALAVSLLAALALLPGCGPRRPPYYGIVASNESGEPVAGVRILFGPRVSLAGTDLAPGGYAGDTGLGAPPPEAADVEWQTADGRRHKERVPVPAPPLTGYDQHQLYFFFCPGGRVELAWVPMSDPAALRRAVRRATGGGE